MGKPRKTTLSKTFSFVTSSLAPHIGDIEARMGKPREKHAFKNVVFSFVTSSLAPLIGDIEARMGKPRKNHTF